jgi:hypothetical protein
MKKQGSVFLPKSPNNSTAKSKDNEMAEIDRIDREFRGLQMIKDLKEDSNNQINEVRKSTQHLHKKVSNMEEKFSKEKLIMKKK